MKRLSTPCMNRFDYKTRRNPEGRQVFPRKQTLDFLRQFARVYQVEPELRQDICAYVIN